MKNLQNIIIGLLAVCVGILFFLYFSEGKVKSSAGNKTGNNPSELNNTSRIAYFEMDSIEQQYLYIKEVQSRLKTKEQALGGELQGLKKTYLARINQLQEKAPTMSQTEGEAAQAEINQMERNMQEREAKLSRDLQEHQFKLMQDINKRIEEFLDQYNKSKGYSYILSRQAGDFIYFKDSTLNITNDVVNGLNEKYNQEKKDEKNP